MILLNGREIAPQKIKRIQLGNRTVYIRRSKMNTAEEFEFNLYSLLKETPTDSIENGIGFLLEIAKSPETELRFVSADIAKIDIPGKTDIGAELYVEITAPMIYDDPVVLVLDAETFSPEAAIFEMEETVPMVFEAEANSPTMMNTEKEEILDFKFEFFPEANSAGAVLAETDINVFKIGVRAEIRTAETAETEFKEDVCIGIDGEIRTAGTDFEKAFINIEIGIDAELWIKPGEWINPVLKNKVLGIEQALSTEKNGNVIKIY